MKSILAIVLAAVCRAAFAVELMLPGDGATVPLLGDGQKAFFDLPDAERLERAGDAAWRADLLALGWWPKPVVFVWSGINSRKERLRFRIWREEDGVCVCDTNFIYLTTGRFEWDNFRVGCGYRWEVDVEGKGSASATFRTEDRPPRLLRVPGVPNVRDLGGRIGLGGRRVRQGRVFRSAGLNDNAEGVYFTRDELEKAGLVTPKMLENEKKIKAHIAKYKGYQADPKTFPRSHKGWQAWAKRHPGAPVADYFARRIADDEASLSKLFKLEKSRKPGKNRLDDATRSYLVDTLGIKSDIDLRSDKECYGMTGSPMGERATWFHYSSSAYAGMQSTTGKDAFKKVFAVFLDEKNYPIDFHCIAGQDRTGAVAFILNGLLGVAEEELYLDWEVTGFWNPSTSFNHARRFDKLVEGFMKKVPGATLHEKIENYVLALGFTKADIEKFRSMMLE